jgi:hypothetical protein
MIKPKGLDMAKIEKLFNQHFTFDKNDLNKGITSWTLTPKREALCPKCQSKLKTGAIVSANYDYYCKQCDEDFFNIEVKK